MDGILAIKNHLQFTCVLTFKLETEAKKKQPQISYDKLSAGKLEKITTNTEFSYLWWEFFKLVKNQYQDN